ncbi:uncharacterized protein AKAME5_001160200 [Lates japonicus]|uniref:Uncharacterized protein n=1 Tax=Lates japonicus TaxID=270547 RepID=A0AAD3MU82_LATJO|nr:uncharacterized protein AKAME5_001160200 [Lates japonicus]
MLTGASYSYPAKKGFDPSSSHGSSHDAIPSSAGSSWEVPSSGGFAASGSGAASTSAYPASAPHSRYSQPSGRELTAPYYSSNTQPGPPQPAAESDFTWAISPSGPFSGEETSRPSAPRPHLAAPELHGPIIPPPPVYQAGELSHAENLYEHGDYFRETEEQGFQPPPPVVHAVGGPTVGRHASPGLPSDQGHYNPYPYYDYRLLTGQYPPGTYTHFSSSFEQGRDYWEDSHYLRYHYPANPVTQEVEIPADVQAPQPSQPVKQPVGSTSRGAVTRRNQPHSSVGLSGSYAPAGRFNLGTEQPAGPDLLWSLCRRAKPSLLAGRAASFDLVLVRAGPLPSAFLVKRIRHLLTAGAGGHFSPTELGTQEEACS